ncbi:MAG: IS4/Tn5 family transposase DNA-binding protein [Acidiferrobacterales bacterium]
MEWVAQEFARADLSDKRLDRRLMKAAQHLAQSPASPINEACGDSAGRQAAYRLFDNPKAAPAAILEPHSQATVERMAGYGGPALVMPDTVFFSYGRHPKTRGLGPIGKSNAAHDRGSSCTTRWPSWFRTKAVSILAGWRPLYAVPIPP